MHVKWHMRFLKTESYPHEKRSLLRKTTRIIEKEAPTVANDLGFDLNDIVSSKVSVGPVTQ